MAGITSAGVGSGLDVQSLVQQLVAAERTPADTRLLTRQSGVQLQLSALGAYRSALAELKSAVEALQAGGALGKLAANSSDTKLFTASAGSGAVAGSYGIEVVEVARAHKLMSGAYAGGSGTALGAGTATITVGAESFQVTLAEGADTLADLRTAINNAADNKGVSATIVNEQAGARLVLTSSTTGTAGALTVSGLVTTSELQAATQAHVRIDGLDHYSSSNEISGAIDGVRLNLLSKSPGTTARLDVALDSAASSSAIEGFVKAYNKMVSTVANLTKYDAGTKKGGPLLGDPAVRNMTQRARDIVSGPASGVGAYAMLVDIGIKTAVDGTLTLDSAKLGSALSADRNSVLKLFTAEGGVATRLETALEGMLDDDGALKAQTEGLNARLKDITRQKEALNLRMDKLEARYLAQFTALDTLIGQMRSTSDFLASQLAGLQQA